MLNHKIPDWLFIAAASIPVTFLILFTTFIFVLLMPDILGFVTSFITVLIPTLIALIIGIYHRRNFAGKIILASSISIILFSTATLLLKLLVKK